MKKIVLGLLMVTTSAFAFDTIGTESGLGTNQAAACKSALNAAESKAQLSVQINSSTSKNIKPTIGTCQCDKQSSGLYECIVSWKVE